MGLKYQVRQLLRMCGHALVRTVHERLDVSERQDNELRLRIADIAETQGALLQASIHQLENFHQAQEASRKERGVLWQQQGLLESLRTQITALEESQRSHQEATIAIQRDGRFLTDREPSLQICVETSKYEFLNPETGLMAFLFSGVPSRRAVDIGAHVGQVSESLLNAGYEVYAFEPNPPVFEKLISRLGNREGFHPFNFALGSGDTEMPLHLAKDLSASRQYVDETAFSSLVPHSMPEDLPFTGTTTVPVKSLASLHQSGAIPGDISLVKIDTEGLDLEVVRGMGDFRYPVVAAEFWDKETPFGQAGVPYTLQSLVEEMRLRGYRYHIVLYRVWGHDQAAYYCNYGWSVPNSYGNSFFFRDYSLFTEAQEWCSAVLPKTYFKPVGSR